MTNLIMQVENIRLSRMAPNALKGEVNEPLKVLESGRDEQRRRPSTLLVKLRSEDLFSIENTIFLFKTNAELVIRKPLTWLLSTLDRF